jgi:hypothetical protein
MVCLHAYPVSRVLHERVSRDSFSPLYTIHVTRRYGSQILPTLADMVSQWCTVFAIAYVNAGVEFCAVSPSLIVRCIHLS